MLQQIINDHNDSDKIYDTANKIYNLCIAEVVRQVSVQCKERGIIIERV